MKCMSWLPFSTMYFKKVRQIIAKARNYFMPPYEVMTAKKMPTDSSVAI